MTMKLTQKRFLKASRNFEIVDDSVSVQIKSLFRGETITVGLSMLSPEPVINGDELEFYGRYKSRPLLSLLLDKPNAAVFNSFVDTLKQTILEQHDPSIGYKVSSKPMELEGNVYDDAPVFDEPDKNRVKNVGQWVDVDKLEEAIHMLQTYVQDESIVPLLAALEALKVEPQEELLQQNVVNVFNSLGITQGSVLTYAPYLSVFVSDDPFGSY